MLRTQIRDMDDCNGRQVDITAVVEVSQYALAIYVGGYGNGTVEGPCAIVNLCIQDGRLKAVLYPDYKTDEGTTIDLEGAKEPTGG